MTVFFSASGAQRNPFAFLLKDKTKSSAVQNVDNLQIENFGKSPYHINKSALSFYIKNSGNFTSKIRFNVTSLSNGRYTFVTEFYSPSDPHQARVDIFLPTLNMRDAGQPFQKPFPQTPHVDGYMKKLFQIEKTGGSLWGAVCKFII